MKLESYNRCLEPFALPGHRKLERQLINPGEKAKTSQNIRSLFMSDSNLPFKLLLSYTSSSTLCSIHNEPLDILCTQHQALLLHMHTHSLLLPLYFILMHSIDHHSRLSSLTIQDHSDFLTGQSALHLYSLQYILFPYARVLYLIKYSIISL